MRATKRRMPGGERHAGINENGSHIRWPADRVERRPIASLIPYANNPRQHPPAQIEQLCRSIKEWGWTIPVLIDEDGGIIAGHGRVLAAQKLGLAEVPVMVAIGWTEAQKRAYVIADNQLTLNSEWDTDLLRGELSALKGLEFDVELLGFGDVQLVEFMSGLPGSADVAGGAGAESGGVSLADKFGVPPFSVLNAREGWWQNRKRAWIALGIQSELGRGEGVAIGGSPMPLDRAKQAKPSQAKPSQAKPSQASPGGSLMPAADYSKRQRGDGRGRPIAQT